jgi:hypothetical protein
MNRRAAVPSVASSSVSVPPQRVVIVGQGYVGLPVSMRAVEAGFDLPSSDEADLAEDVFVPRLEKGSGLTARADFAVGYSPERIDPSNRIWNFRNTPKIVAGIDAASLNAVDAFYAAVAVVERLVAAGAEVAAADPLVSTGDVPAGVMVVDCGARRRRRGARAHRPRRVRLGRHRRRRRQGPRHAQSPRRQHRGDPLRWPVRAP